jgi:hypothetical protein
MRSLIFQRWSGSNGNRFRRLECDVGDRIGQADRVESIGQYHTVFAYTLSHLLEVLLLHLQAPKDLAEVLCYSTLERVLPLRWSLS